MTPLRLPWRIKALLIVPTLVWALLVTGACASLKTKDQLSRATQSVYATLQTLDALETNVCKPATPPNSNLCTATPRILTDRDHQAISRYLAQAYGANEQALRLLAAWDPSTPKPTNLPSARIYLEQIKSLLQAIPQAPPEIAQLLNLVQAVFDAIEASGAIR